jgi:serine protease Do
MVGRTCFGLALWLMSAAALEAQHQAEPVSYRDIVKKVLPAVVSIEVTEQKPVLRTAARTRPGEEGQDDPIREFFEEQLGRRQPPVHPFGSGVIVDPRGVVVTNHHVVEGAAVVKVTLQDGRSFKSRDIAGDSKTDLAIIKLDTIRRSERSTELPSIGFGDSNRMEIGDRVLAIGAPFGLQGSVTHGIISAKGRNNINLNIYEDYLQTDAAINPGNSGGPLVNLDGLVVGINTAIQSRTGSFDGVGLAIPSAMAKEVVDQLVRQGKVRRGYLGVTLMPLDNPTVNTLLGLPDGKGVGVGTVSPETPAAKAGLLEGDIILRIGEQAVEDLAGLKRVIAALAVGRSVPMSILRGTEVQIVTVTIDEQPEQYGLVREPPRRRISRGGLLEDLEPVAVRRIGVDVADLTAELVEVIGLPKATQGAFVLGVERESIGSDGHLTRGMVVIQVDRKPVKNAEEFKQAIHRGDLGHGILLLAKRPDGAVVYLALREGE